MWNERKWVAGIAAMLVIVAVAVLGWRHFRPGHAGGHAAHGEHAGLQGLTLNEGRKWATDEPLRLGMANIRSLLAQAGPASKMDTARAAALADGIHAQVNYLLVHCKLEPRADAVLHVLIAEVLAGAGELAEPATRAQGVAAIERALQEYPKYFDPPGWS